MSLPISSLHSKAMSKFEINASLLDRVDLLRIDANRGLNSARKSDLGQFMSPAPVAKLMAELLAENHPEVRLLDAGAGVGSLSAGAVAELCRRKNKPKSIVVSAFEIDDHMIPYLTDTMTLCEAECEKAGIEFCGKVIHGNFLEEAASRLEDSLFKKGGEQFNCAILNPPYKKIGAKSEERRLLKAINADSSNIYTGFLAAAVHLLEDGGELVAITPRSFCNGSYFRGFRAFFLEAMGLTHLHVFESRQQAFKDDEVLQENIIMRAVKSGAKDKVTITCGVDANDHEPLTRTSKYSGVVNSNDPQSFIYVSADELGMHVANRMATLSDSVSDLGLTISTGRVVDFRAKEYLRAVPNGNTVPLIWAFHFVDGEIKWQKEGAKKPEAIVRDESILKQLVPDGNYVLVKRFSAKEEKRRVVASVFEGGKLGFDDVGFENHLNFFHESGHGMSLELARGLAVFLNSTLVDAYFRQFNGHTQVNATDLRSIRYPTASQLVTMGKTVGKRTLTQAEIDQLVDKELGMNEQGGIDPAAVREKVEQAVVLLKVLGLPRQQLNERSGLTLLALLGLKPEMKWKEASAPLCGITPMMDFFRDYYGKEYKPNTRETVRRQSVHQFLDAGLIVANPDRLDRPVNSPKAVYQIEASALELLQGFGGKSWKKDLQTYLSTIKTLKEKYAQEREMKRIPVKLAAGMEITLSPGGQNVLVKEIVDQFAPCFASPGKFIYVGDTDEKYAYFDEDALKELGVTLNAHGKMPDVLIHYTEKNWLLLIEAVTSHGPINPKRQKELRKLFGRSQAGLVYVTTFLTRKAMIAYLDEISWETEVWVAESPTHMIHFNGKRFLGPYPE